LVKSGEVAMQVLSVGQLVMIIRSVLESEPLLQDVWVRGEISNLSRAASGHTYFSVVDADSQLKCVLFRHSARYQPFQPTNGALAIVHGRISLYDASGALQLYVDLLQPDGIGAGALHLAQVRQRLLLEGLFDAGRKRALPRFPSVVGVVTSAHGAVWHDIQQIVARRFPSVVLLLSPAQVQGEGAAASIVSALRRLWELECCDVIIVGRGGGAALDLDAFNDEQVARAIYASPVPIISAVGHETDHTIADDVADVRAPTPSTAAELAVPDRALLLEDLAQLSGRLRAAMTTAYGAGRDRTDDLGHRLLRHSPRTRLADSRQRLDDLSLTLRRLVGHQQTRRRLELGEVAGSLRALDPAAVLARGYAVVTVAATGAVVTRVGDVSNGDRLQVRVADGQLGAEVRDAGGSQA
jgi:exodeoxyribonuclease VII large subunit